MSNSKKIDHEEQFRKICRLMLENMYNNSDTEGKKELLSYIDSTLNELAVKGEDNDFDELGTNQDYSNLFKSLEPEPTKEPEPEEEPGLEDEEEVDYTGVKTGEGMFKDTKKQRSNYYEDLFNKKDRTLFQNWYMINNLLLNRQDESSLVPPKGVPKTDPDEFLRSIDLTGVAEDLEVKTASPGDGPGPDIEPAAFNRDENDRVSAYDIIDQYISSDEDSEEEEGEIEISAQPTGINSLGEYFKQVREKITDKYNTLTSDPKQRAAFIKTFLTLSKAHFDEMDAKLENPGVSTEE